MSERLGWDYDYLLSKVKNAFRYIKSGILINSISEGYNALSDTPVEHLWDLRTKSVTIDTPNRYLLIMLGKYTSKYVKSDKYFALFYEDYHGEASDSVLIVDVPDGREKELLELIEEIYTWYHDNRDKIAEDKAKVLSDIVSQLKPEQAKELLETIVSVLEKASHK